jgi:hypothetical protein
VFAMQKPNWFDGNKRMHGYSIVTLVENVNSEYLIKSFFVSWLYQGIAGLFVRQLSKTSSIQCRILLD